MADITTQVLIEIRDEVRKTNSRLDTTNEQLDTTNERLDRLERRQVETEMRLATELVAVAGAVRDLREAIVDDLRLAVQVGDHERRIAVLEGRQPG